MGKSNGVNLLSPRLRRMAAIRRRTRLWATVLGGYVVLVLGAGGSFAALDSSGPDLAARLRDAQARLESAKAEFTRSAAALNTERRKVEAASVVSKHPDWSIVLGLLARSCSPGLSLTRIDLSRLEERGADDATRGSAKNAAALGGGYSIGVQGTAPTQADATSYVLSLERSGVFDRVEIVEARAIPGQLVGATFQLRCVLVENTAASPSSEGKP
ncbi:MAG: hypothetical protein IPK69_08335 [Phycisphaerales bacterium]|nr:MAG: hypothetical protein IPK69_08335 [Phycisphaerales bacterium]